MAKKLKCTVTGNWTYCSEERYAELVKKFGSEAELQEKYVSRLGKKVQEEGGKAPHDFKNKIRCTVTGELCYISDERMEKLVKEKGSEEEVRKTYISRVAQRLLKEGKTKTEIKDMAKSGTLPPPTGAPKAEKPAKAPKAKKGAKADHVSDNAKDGVADLVKDGATDAAGAPAATVAAKKSTKKGSAKKATAKKRSR